MRDPMRVLFVIDCLGSGGAQRQMVSLALGLAQRGYAVEFFVYYPEKDHFTQVVEDAGIQIHTHRKAHRFSLSVIRALRDLIRRGQFDLVLSFLATPNFYNIIAGRSLSERPVIVVSERSSDLHNRIPVLERIARSLYRFADHVIVNYDHQKGVFFRKYPALRSKLSKIYNGYDLAFFAPAETPQDFPHSNLQILVIASISPHKNGLCLVRALKILRQSFGLAVNVSWVGEQVISAECLSYRQQMEHEISLDGLSDQWCWLGRRNDIVQLAHDHDLLVHPSYVEGLPNAICEALACGCPVIASDTLDHPRLVQENVTGFLFDWRSPEDLARAINSFAQLSVEARTQMGKNARDFAKAHLSLPHYIDAYEILFKSLVRK